jgi:hypothetical protein
VPALTQAGFAHVVMGSPERGHELLDDALELASSVGDDRLRVETLLMAADLRLESGHAEAARAPAIEALKLSELIGDDWILGRAITIDARANHDELGYEEAHRRLGRALALFERADDQRQVGRVLMTMAYFSLEAMALDAADDEARRCIELGDRLEHAIGTAVANVVRVWVAIERGEHAAARGLLAGPMSTAAGSGYAALLGQCVAAEAALVAAEGDDERAAQLLGAVIATGDALGGEGGRSTVRAVGQLQATLGERLGAAQLETLMAQGAGVPLAEIAAGSRS